MFETQVLYKSYCTENVLAFFWKMWKVHVLTTTILI